MESSNSHWITLCDILALFRKGPWRTRKSRLRIIVFHKLPPFSFGVGLVVTDIRPSEAARCWTKAIEESFPRYRRYVCSLSSPVGDKPLLEQLLGLSRDKRICIMGKAHTKPAAHKAQSLNSFLLAVHPSLPAKAPQRGLAPSQVRVVATHSFTQTSSRLSGAYGQRS